MYVDVIACRRGRVRVDVNLIKSSSCGTASAPIRVPVGKRTVQLDPDLFAKEVSVRGLIEQNVRESRRIKNVSVKRNVGSASLSEPQGKEDELLGEEQIELLLESIIVDEESALESELLISDEDDNEQMASEAISEIDKILAESDADTAVDELENVVSGALEELDSMSKRTDDMIEHLDDQLADALDEINDSTDENAEQFNSIISECLEDVENAVAQRELQQSNPELAALEEKGAYIRYISRDDHGDKVEVARRKADGQEVVCYDNDSGKLSRVCGIIKKESDNKTTLPS